MPPTIADTCAASPLSASDVNSNALLIRYLKESDCEIRALGKVLGGFDVLCAVSGGKKDPPILITSGAHADEVAGVHAALRLLREIKTEHRLYVLPVRDPFGFEGYRANLEFAMDKALKIDTAADVYQVLRHGRVLYEQGTYILAQIGEYVFAYDVGIDFSSSSVGRRIEPLVVEDSRIMETLSRAKRVIAPWNLPMPRAGDCYKQGARGMIVIPSGFVGNFNRFFDQSSAPLEVVYPRNLVDELKPGLVLDLHEGYGRGFYTYKAEREDPTIERVVSALTTAVRDKGGINSTPEELQPYWGPRVGHDRRYFGNGVFYSGSTTRSSFSQYCQHTSCAFTFETGGLNPPNWRTDLHVWAAKAAISAWEAFAIVANRDPHT
jgi:hypothetical protein